MAKSTDAIVPESGQRESVHAIVWVAIGGGIVAVGALIIGLIFSNNGGGMATLTPPAPATTAAPTVDRWWENDPVATAAPAKSPAPAAQQPGTDHKGFDPNDPGLAKFTPVDTQTQAITSGVPIASPNVARSVETEPVARQRSAEAIYAEAVPAVATIGVMNDRGELIAQASGFFISDDHVPHGYHFDPATLALARQEEVQKLVHSGVTIAYALTNFHVIRHAAIGDVVLHDKTVGKIADVLAEDPDSDVALVSVVLPAKTNPSKLHLSKSSIPKVGATVFAIGSPRGLTNSLSPGWISGHRPEENPQYLQFTSPISHGSSGGPLLNDRGEVVGITTAYDEGGQNLNFAVAIPEIRHVLEQSLTPRPLWRGVSISEEEGYVFRRAVAVSRADPTLSRFADLLPSSTYLLDVLPKKYAGIDAVITELREALRNTNPDQKWTPLKLVVAFTTAKLHSQKFQKAASLLGEDNAARSRLADHDANYKAAIEAYVNAIALDQNFSPALDGLYSCYLDAGKKDESLKAATRLVECVPRCGEAYFDLALCQDDQGNIAAAVGSLKQAVSYDPSNALAWESLAGDYVKMEEYEKAVQAYQNEVDIYKTKSASLADVAGSDDESGVQAYDNDVGVAYFNMSIALANLHKYKSAYGALEKAHASFVRLGWAKNARDCDTRMANIRMLIGN